MKKTISPSTDVYQTGYYVLANPQGLVPKPTKTHIVVNGSPLCGYTPHKKMTFQWTANSVQLNHVDCPKCREMNQPKTEPKTKPEPLKSTVTLQDLTDIIHMTVIKNEKVNKKILKEIQSIQDKINSGKLKNYHVQTPLWWTCVFADVKANGYEIKEKP